MAESITLKIFTPEKAVLNRKAFRVVLPYGKVNLTLGEKYAPTSLFLHAGAVQILDSADKIISVYFIDGGVADIAQDVCTVSTRYFLKQSDITRESALKKAGENDETHDFYQAVADYFTAHP